MKHWHQMSVTAETGVGSSTLLKGLADRFIGKLPYRFVSGGSIMRAKAAELNMTIEEFSAYNKLCPEEGHDVACDQTIARFAEHKHVICEGRLPHFFMPYACHVLLRCNPVVRAERRKLQKGFEHLSVVQILEAILKRDADDNARYRAIYGPECIWRQEQFDVVVDSTELSKEVTLAQVVSGYEEWLQQAALV